MPNFQIPAEMDSQTKAKVEANLTTAKAAADEALKLTAETGKPEGEEAAKKFEELCAKAKASTDYAENIITLWKATQPAATVKHETKAEKDTRKQFKSLAQQVLGSREEFKGFDAQLGSGFGEATWNFKAPMSSTSLGTVDYGTHPVLVDPVIEQELLMLPRRELVIADLFSRGQTAGTTIYYKKQATRTANAGNPWVSEGGTKPQSAMTFESASTTVKKIAHWESITTEMLADYPQMESLINDDLIYGLNYKVDEALLWGTGNNDSITGLFNTANVQVQADVQDNTNLDLVRRMITKIQIIGQGYFPSGVAMTAQQWEGFELLKDDNKQYLWVVKPDGMVPRIWRLPIVLSQALINPDAVTKHRMVVGAFQRGAKIYDREAQNIEVGLVNDQLIKNERTIVAEQRLAFAVKIPTAFIYHEDTIS